MKKINVWSLLKGIKEGSRDLPFSIKYDGKVYFRNGGMITYANIDNYSDLLKIETLDLNYSIEIVENEDPENVENDINDLIFEFRQIMNNKEISKESKKAKLYNILSRIGSKVRKL